MTTTLRTYSKKIPRAPLLTVSRAADWDELDELISEGDLSGSKGRGKRKEDFTGKENAVNQISNDQTRPTKKVYLSHI
jgi:hypothetical protein